MCKNMFIAGIKPSISEQLLWDFLMAATPFMSASDPHGIGYAALSPAGVWGERWQHPTDAWKYRKEWTQEDQAVHDQFKGTLEAAPRYNSFGTAEPKDTCAVIYHARMATCEKTLANTHPFVRDGVALIHNGVINNTQELQNLTSTCDSECILNEYVDQDVMNHPDRIKAVTSKIQGYYCCAVLSKDSQGNEHVDIFKSNGAQLYAYWVPELEAIVFCTSSEIIRNTCKKLGMDYGNTFRFQDDVMVRINAKTGEFVSRHEYKPAARWVSVANSWSGVGTEKKSLAVVSSLEQTIGSQTKNTPTSGNECSNDGASSNPFYYKGDGYPAYNE